MRLSEIGPLEAASLDTGLGEKKKKRNSATQRPLPSQMYPVRYPMEKERHLQTQA